LGSDAGGGGPDAGGDGAVEALATDTLSPARYVDRALVGELARKRNKMAASAFDFSDGRY
jgi:hypothetical protein